ncbi:hypothetical protein [Methylobacterium sp. A54F]
MGQAVHEQRLRALFEGDDGPAADPPDGPAGRPGSGSAPQVAAADDDLFGDRAEVDWPGAVQLIRDVGTRVRRSRDQAQETVRRSQALIKRSIVQAEEAEERVRTAEAAAAQAQQRAERAEAAAAAAEARARAAEAEARVARAAQAEAQAWLKRVYVCVRTEFESLTDEVA